MSIRILQVYGGLCLAAFCKRYRISHQLVNELVTHLFAAAVSDNLPNWNKIGADLVLNGRGDPIPRDVIKAVPSNVASDFERLVSYSVEIGTVCLFCASTHEPVDFLNTCISILDDHNIEIQFREQYDAYCNETPCWGEPISMPELNEMLVRYERMFVDEK